MISTGCSCGLYINGDTIHKARKRKEHNAYFVGQNHTISPGLPSQVNTIILGV